jgi:ACS family glucarate transporter-like MFS transporter
LFAISIVTYIDRVNISVTARQMMPALGLSQQDIGWIFSAFVIGYALFQIPGGWMSDRWGARPVLGLALIWWSCFTALTALVPASGFAQWTGIFAAMAVTRFLLGVGESVALPTFNRAVTDWLPSHERGLGIGIAIGGIGLGSAVTPPATAWIMVNYGWQTAFYVSAMIGFVLAAAWWRLSPGRRSAASRRENDGPALAGPVPWKRFLRLPTVWCLVLSYTCLGYVAYVYMSWFYLYLVDVRGFTLLRGGWFASAPFLAILIFCPAGGLITDRLAAARGVTAGRRLVGMAGMALAAASIAVGGVIEDPYLAVAGLSLGAGWLYFTVGAYWSSTSDLSASHAGFLSGVMNMGANVGGALSPSMTPWIAARWGWPASLATAAGVALLGAVLWAWIDPGKGLDGNVE